VHRLKPTGYFPRFRSSIQEIQDCIEDREQTGRWRPDLPRPRQRQWWRRLGRMASLILGAGYSASPADAFNLLMNKGFIPVTSAELQENRTM